MTTYNVDRVKPEWCAQDIWDSAVDLEIYIESSPAEWSCRAIARALSETRCMAYRYNSQITDEMISAVIDKAFEFGIELKASQANWLLSVAKEASPRAKEELEVLEKSSKSNPNTPERNDE